MEDGRLETEGVNDELFDKGKEFMKTMSVETLIRFQSNIKKNLSLERGLGSPSEQKAYSPMPWMIPNMERGIRIVDELLKEKQ